jgi:ribose-phosphate pyrophosphokinase
MAIDEPAGPPTGAGGEVAPFNQHGGLTLIPMPGFESLALEVERRIEADRYQFDTPVDVADFEFGHRASGEPYIRLGKEHIAGHDCVVLTSGPGTPDMLLQLMLMLRYLSGRRASRISVVTGYFPLGRSDKDVGTLEFALPPLDRVIAVDLHAPQVVMSGRTGFITEVSMARRMLKRALEEATALDDPVCLCFPDDTAAKRMEPAVLKVAEGLEATLPAVYGVKRRTSSVESTAGELSGDVEALRGATVLILDDEIAPGGTTIDRAAELKAKHGASRVWAVVTHGVLCGAAPQRLAEPSCAVDRIFISDTIPVSTRPELKPLVESGRLDVTSWCSDLAWILYHHHWNLSIRELR